MSEPRCTVRERSSADGSREPAGATVGSLVMGRDLSPPALFVGRAREIERLSVLHERIRTGVVYGVPGVGKSTLAQVFASRWTGGVVVQRALPGQSMETLLEDLRRVLCSGAAPAMTSNAARAVDLAARLDGRRIPLALRAA